MKILIANTLYYPYKIGGAEVSVQLLAESLVKNGHDVHVVTLSDGTLQARESINGVHLYRMPIKNIYWPFGDHKPSRLTRLIWHIVDIYNPFSKAAFSRLMREIAPDILHTNNLAGFSVALWDAAAKQGIPIAHTARDYYLIHPNSRLYTDKPQNPNSLSCTLFSAIKKWRSRSVQNFISISNHVRQQHLSLDFFPDSMSRVIYNSIRLPPLDLRENFLDSKITLGYLGRIEKPKGIEFLLDTFSELSDQYNLVIAGTGDNFYTEELKTRYRALNITWLGHTSPAEFFRKIDYLVVPSLWDEPLGRVVLEAYSYETPVIGSDAGGIPEIIFDGITGTSYQRNSKESFKKALSQITSAPYIYLKKSCAEYARKYSELEVVNIYQDEYIKIALPKSIQKNKHPQQLK